MKKTMTRLIACTLFVFLQVTTANAATYSLQRMVGDYSVAGTFVTNVDAGALNSTNFVDWDITITYLPTSVAADLNSSNSSIIAGGSALSATPAGLSFNFSSTNVSFFQVYTDSSAWAVGTVPVFCGGFPGPGECAILTDLPLSFITRPGVEIIAELVPVPIPAAVWLLVSALAGTGFIRRRRPG